MAIIRNFFAGIGCLTILVILAIVGWLYRGEIEEWLESRNQIVMAEPSSELADVAADKIQQLRDGTGPVEVRFSEMELQSYVQYRLAEDLPTGVSNPAVDLKDSTIAMSAALDLKALTMDGVDAVRSFLGDSALVVTELFPTVDGAGLATLAVLSLQAGVVPIPPMLIPKILSESGLPAEGNQVRFEIPTPLDEIRIEEETVIITRSR